MRDLVSAMTPSQHATFDQLVADVDAGRLSFHARIEWCWSCDEPAEFLCDGAVSTVGIGGASGSVTCDMPLCGHCAVSRLGMTDRHLCAGCAKDYESQFHADAERKRRASPEGVNRFLGRKYSKLRERGQLLKKLGPLVYSGKKPKDAQ